MADILVVENNEHISRMFKEILTRDGHNVTFSSDGRIALELIDKNHFELAFIDLGLPDISGLEILKSLKLKSPLTISTVISGQNDIDYAIESIKAGVFRYLKKPFDIDDIRETINLAHQERIHMLQTGYTPGQAIPVVNRNRVANRTKLAVDMPLVILALLLGFIVQQEVYRRFEMPTVWGTSEIVFLALSFACCFGFMHIRSLRTVVEGDNMARFRKDFMNLTSVYLIFTAILFFTTNLIDSRLVLISGFCMGVGGLWLSRFMLTPLVARLVSGRYEGRRRIVLKGFARLPSEKPGLLRPGHAEPGGEPTPAFNMKPSGGKLTEIKSGKTAQDYSNRSEFEVSGLIQKFKDNRSKLNLTKVKRRAEKIVQ